MPEVIPVQPNPDNTTDPLLQFFKWKHLPPLLQPHSKPFALQAANLVKTTPRCPERTAALRKLMEAKDCAVRAQLPSQVVTVDELLETPLAKCGQCGEDLSVNLHPMGPCREGTPSILL
jgi:hypothetical protein